MNVRVMLCVAGTYNVRAACGRAWPARTLRARLAGHAGNEISTRPTNHYKLTDRSIFHNIFFGTKWVYLDTWTLISTYEMCSLISLVCTICWNMRGIRLPTVSVFAKTYITICSCKIVISARLSYRLRASHRLTWTL